MGQLGRRRRALVPCGRELNADVDETVRERGDRRDNAQHHKPLLVHTPPRLRPDACGCVLMRADACGCVRVRADA